jgi:Transcription factor WhiB
VRIWYDRRAACQDVDTSVFFDLALPANKEMALALCRSCQVRDDCLDAAMKEEAGSQKFGIRGGLTADERKALVKNSSYRRKRDARADAA